jgi:hypothetical protein
LLPVEHLSVEHLGQIGSKAPLRPPSSAHVHDVFDHLHDLDVFAPPWRGAFKRRHGRRKGRIRIRADDVTDVIRKGRIVCRRRGPLQHQRDVQRTRFKLGISCGHRVAAQEILGGVKAADAAYV